MTCVLWTETVSNCCYCVVFQVGPTLAETAAPQQLVTIVIASIVAAVWAWIISCMGIL